MSATRIREGWCDADIIDGYRVKRIYIGYSKKESLELFKQEFLK